MIAVLDTNILFSALVSPHGIPGLIYTAWLDSVFELATNEQQIEELRLASRAPKWVGVLTPHHVGFAINRMRKSSLFYNVPRRYTTTDATDSFLLDLAAAAHAHYLVTGDKKSGLLQLGKLGNTKILTPTNFFQTALKPGT